MNKEQTLALWAQGKDAWNAWANDMLARRAEMEQAGMRAASGDGVGLEKPDTEATADWMAEAAADFGEHTFNAAAGFASVLFPSTANFEKARFLKDAWFASATFNGDAWFGSASFSGTAWFGSATFSGTAGFAIATFSGDTWFDDATFSGTAEFGFATFSRDAWFGSATFSRDAAFDRATFSGTTGFCSAMFSRNAVFDGATFSGTAEFGFATFSRDAWFGSATFNGTARFGSATFSRGAEFESATFSGDASFDRATFSETAWFENAKFSGEARFRQCSFAGYTSFARAAFEKQANFAAAQGERGFSLASTRFAEVPDFIQAHFAEAPRLDNVRVRRGKGDADLSARYRALKRLAIDGHDHAREQEYFAGELKALRGHSDRWYPNPLNWLRRDDDGERLPAWPGGARYWFGVFYQILSDFGRSMLRPLGWWGLALAGFAFGYLDRHFDRAAELGRGYAGGVGGWLWASIAQPLVAWFPSLANLLPLPAAVASPACLVGPGEPWSAALGLSIRKALPFAGVGSTEKLNQIYACLYGIHGDVALPGVLPARFTPVIPDAVDYLGIVQLLLSLLLLFLFLLAVRSHFRIR